MATGTSSRLCSLTSVVPFHTFILGLVDIDIARHIIQGFLSPCLLSLEAPYEVASNIRKTLSSNAF